MRENASLARRSKRISRDRDAGRAVSRSALDAFELGEGAVGHVDRRLVFQSPQVLHEYVDVLVEAVPWTVYGVESLVWVIFGMDRWVLAGRAEREVGHVGLHAAVADEGRGELETTPWSGRAVAASPRLSSGVSPAQELVIETGFQLLIDALLYVASDHRAWALERLPAGARERKRAEVQLGGLVFDVEGQGALAAYLRELYGARLSVSARKGGAPRLLRLQG